MRVIIEQPAEGAEEEIIIRLRKPDSRIAELIRQINSAEEKLTAYYPDGSISVLDPSEIYYIESVDSKVFAYGKSDVAELKQKLYELEERFAGTDLIRISKSMILDLSKVKRFAPSIGGRFEAVLTNDEKVIISRQYVPDVKKRLGL